MKALSFTICLSVAVGVSSAALSQNAAPSSHFVFDDNFAGDIIVNEVRVPKGGEAMYTYYETLGWRGKGAGYAGIQVHPKAHLYIFSIWDHKEHKKPIRAVYRGAKTKTEGFGGEGTGLKSWNFDLGWERDVWYTLVARTWPVGDHTYYGFWVRSDKTKKWTHLVTMDVAVKTTFEGGTDAFIEDWLDTGKNARTTNLRGGWKRKLDGTWYAFQKGRYSVNYWDLEKGKRSYNYRTSWDGGVAKDASGEFYYMIAGGKTTKPTTKNPSSFAIARKDKDPPYRKIELTKVSATMTDDKTLKVAWEVDATRVPQFAYEVAIYADRAGKTTPLLVMSRKVPHAREVELDVSLITKVPVEKCFVHVSCTDVFDLGAAAKVAQVAVAKE